MEPWREELYHHGILGMKWGVRRYQNADGSLTDAGAKRYNKKQRKDAKKEAKAFAKNEKNYEVGKTRLENRIRVANTSAEVDKYASKTGWKNTLHAAERNKEIEGIKNMSREILSDKERTARLGQKTRRTRIATVALSSSTAIAAATVGSFIVADIGSAGLLTIPLAAAGASIAAGKSYYNKTKY